MRDEIQNRVEPGDRTARKEKVQETSDAGE